MIDENNENDHVSQDVPDVPDVEAKEIDLKEATSQSVRIFPPQQKPEAFNVIFWFTGAKSLNELYDVDGWKLMTSAEKVNYVKTEVLWASPYVSPRSPSPWPSLSWHTSSR